MFCFYIYTVLLYYIPSYICMCMSYVCIYIYIYTHHSTIEVLVKELSSDSEVWTSALSRQCWLIHSFKPTCHVFVLLNKQFNSCHGKKKLLRRSHKWISQRRWVRTLTSKAAMFSTQRALKMLIPQHECCMGFHTFGRSMINLRCHQTWLARKSTN